AGCVVDPCLRGAIRHDDGTLRRAVRHDDGSFRRAVRHDDGTLRRAVRHDGAQPKPVVIVLGFAFVAGLLTILAPCTLPVIPLVLGGATGGGRRRIAAIFTGFAASFVGATVL